MQTVRDFDRSSGDRVVQQADKHTRTARCGWSRVIDADPDARQRTVKIKIAAQVQPGTSPGAGVAVHRDRVRRPDGHPVRGRVPLFGRRQEQVRRAAGILAEGHGRAGLPRGGSAARLTRRDRPPRPGRAPVPAGRLPAPALRAVPGPRPDVRHRRRGHPGQLHPAGAVRGGARGLRPAARGQSLGLRGGGKCRYRARPSCPNAQSRTR